MKQPAHRPPIPLSEQIVRLRWQVPLIAILLVIVHQAVEHLWLAIPERLTFVSETILYGLTGPVFVWLALGWIRRKVAIKEMAEAELVNAHTELQQLNQRISFLLEVNQRLAEATDEASLAALALQLPGEIVPAVVACAVVRFDEHRQPMPVEYQGHLDEATLVDWHQYLASQNVRLRCGACKLRTAEFGQPCPLFERLPVSGIGRIVCLPLERHGKQFAILGLFLAAGRALTDGERDLLEAVAAEIAIAFENSRLRTQELVTLYEINETLQQRLDFDGLMTRLLTRTMEASHADAGLLLLRGADGTLTPCATAGEWNGAGRLPLVESLAAGTIREGAGEPVVANLQAADPNTASVLCAPMTAEGEPLGVIVLGSRRRGAFLRQQVRLVSAIAGQAALLAENTRLYARLEHHAILAERARLAREMHDGLAQTLGYIKMRAGQITHWVENDQTERAGAALRELAQTANDAYLDLRAALDGLRLPLLAPETDSGFAAQLRHLAQAFENQSGLSVEAQIEVESPLPLATQAHLLRIVQETLTNIRKHARADHVRLDLAAIGDHLRLTLQDDGQGFDAGQNLPETRHGLRLMRERAELLGADLQVTSMPGKGTQVIVELPLSDF